METFYAEIEYWDERTGREVLLAALRAAERVIIPESIHVYDPDVLGVRGMDEGEVSLWFSIALMPGFTPHDFFATVRAARIRVKETGYVPADVARGTREEFWGWMHAQYEEMRATWEETMNTLYEALPEGE